MTVKRIHVLGGGFAGLWSALGAARAVDRYNAAPHAVRITLVNRDAYHAIRVRNYEADLSDARVPLDDVLGPAGVERIEGEVMQIDVAHSEQGVRFSGARSVCRNAIPLVGRAQSAEPTAWIPITTRDRSQAGRSTPDR